MTDNPTNQHIGDDWWFYKSTYQWWLMILQINISVMTDDPTNQCTSDDSWSYKSTYQWWLMILQINISVMTDEPKINISVMTDDPTNQHICDDWWSYKSTYQTKGPRFWEWPYLINATIWWFRKSTSPTKILAASAPGGIFFIKWRFNWKYTMTYINACNIWCI